MNTLIRLLDYGQSYWLDNLSRKIITSGELKKRVTTEGLRGITSNPSIFNQSISGGTEYDEEIRIAVEKGAGPREIYDALTVKDVQDACNILEPVYKESGGTDGFVSLEVSPHLARDTKGTMEEARRLHRAVNRKNCLIKIPGTKEGIPAIEEMLYEGININVTLLFSTTRYTEVAEAYLRALTRRMKEGKSLDQVISVASFFLSRIDTLTDQILGQYLSLPTNDDQAVRAESLVGKTGTASALLAYQRFLSLFNSDEWNVLKKKGAHVQRLLWASTSNKDPLYSPLRYVEPLIGPDTVNTLPDQTIEIFRKEGQLKKNAIEQGLPDAKRVFSGLSHLHIDLDSINQQLENEGVQKFTEAFRELMSNLALKRQKLMENKGLSQTISSGSLEKELKNTYVSLDEKQAVKRLFALDAHLWKSEEEQLKTIKEGLGWLALPEAMLPEAEKFVAFAEQIRKEGYTGTVLLGMGGSSLCSEVARETFGSAKGFPKLYVLDNTAPEAIEDLEKQIDLEKTLFIVASKSGSTLETNCFFRYFYNKLEKKSDKGAGRNFVAITDAGTSMVTLASEYNFRHTFINPPDVGGRYSVLSDFGILPMALVGIDVKALLKSAQVMARNCGTDVPAAVNPGVSLGALLGTAQSKGRDKVTFVLSSSLTSFGYWVEQLIAESTGKEGKGLIPVNGEKPGKPEDYGNDRVFVHMFLAGDSNGEDEKKLTLLEKAGHPVVRIRIQDKLDLGGAYFQWEIATAIAGLVIGINPFDQPNVAESKKNTNNILDEWIREGSFEKQTSTDEQEGISITSGKRTSGLQASEKTGPGVLIHSFLDLAGENDYVALLPYFEMTSERSALLNEWRDQIRNKQKKATTLLNGPRYLHSTGQLHKGGPDSGLYILLSSTETTNLEIPGQKYGFAILHEAQARGDFRSLDDKGRRVICINLGKDTDAGLRKLMAMLKDQGASSIQTNKHERASH